LVGQPHRLVLVAHPRDGQERAEGLLLHDQHVVRDAEEHGRLEVPAFRARAYARSRPNGFSIMTRVQASSGSESRSCACSCSSITGKTSGGTENEPPEGEAA
jgi:hypothetical protein